MIHGSVAFETAIQGSHTLAVRCEAWLAGRRVAADLPLMDNASISVDSSRFVRRSAKLSFKVGSASEAQTLRGVLNQPGCEIRIWRGVSLKFGRDETLPVHWGIVDKVSGSWPDLSIQVDCPDLAQRVAYDRFAAPRQSRAGFTTSQQIQALVGESIRRLQYVDSSGSAVAVPSVSWDRDRNSAVDKLAVSVGAESFFQPPGQWLTRPIQTLLGVPALRVREGVALASASDDTDWSSVRNDVIVTCERADGTKLSGRSTDTDPASPTCVTGPLGRRTGFYASSLFTTSAQCNITAAALRARMSGARVSIAFTTLVHPGLEAGDRVDVTMAGSTARLIVDSFDLPVFGASMTGQGRMMIVPEGLD